MYSLCTSLEFVLKFKKNVNTLHLFVPPKSIFKCWKTLNTHYVKLNLGALWLLLINRINSHGHSVLQNNWDYPFIPSSCGPAASCFPVILRSSRYEPLETECYFYWFKTEHVSCLPSLYSWTTWLWWRSTPYDRSFWTLSTACTNCAPICSLVQVRDSSWTFDPQDQGLLNRFGSCPEIQNLGLSTWSAFDWGLCLLTRCPSLLKNSLWDIELTGFMLISDGLYSFERDIRFSVHIKSI